MLLRVTNSEPSALNTNDFFSQPSVSQILEILIHKNTQYYPSTIRDNIYQPRGVTMLHKNNNK